MIKPKILIIDDEKPILSAMQRSLKDDFDVFTAETPEQALEIIRDNDIEAVISDYALGEGITGADLLSVLSKDKPHIARIMLTGHHAPHIAEEAINRAGVFKFITKPWDDKELKFVLYSAVKRSNIIKGNIKVADEIKDKNKKIELTTAMIERDLKLSDKKIERSKEHISSYQEQLNAINEMLEKISSGKTFNELVSATLSGLSGVVEHDRSCIAEMFDGSDTLNVYSSANERKVHISAISSIKSIREPLILNSIYASSDLKEQLLQDKDLYSLMIYPIFLRGTEQESRIFMVILARKGKRVFERDEVVRLNDISSSIKVALERITTTSYLQTALKQWENTFNSILDPLFIVSPEYTVLRINNAVEKIVGQNSSLVVGQKCYEIFKDIDDVCSDCLINRTMSSGVVESCDIAPCFGRSNISASSYPVFGHDGKLNSVIQYNNDRSAEFKLYKQLIQSEKLAAVGVLASNIAHEINNPLGGVLAYSQILKKEAVEGSQIYSDLDEIEKACLRGKNIISNLLDFSRDSSSDGKLPVPLKKIIDDTLPLLNICLKGHKLNISVDDNNVMVLCNVGELQQVVFNLITNAVHASPNGGEISIKVSTDNDKVLLLVKDNGQGIPQENIAKIFEPFFTTKEKGKGTGLGLFVCYGIIKDHGGDVSVQSVVGEGTVFKIGLPVWSA